MWREPLESHCAGADDTEVDLDEGPHPEDSFGIGRVGGLVEDEDVW